MQPDWLIDRAKLAGVPPARVRASAVWRIPEGELEEAQDAATLMAIREMERAGIDILTDGEVRRESYSNRFHAALDGLELDEPATIPGRAGKLIKVPRIVGPLTRRERRWAEVGYRNAVSFRLQRGV